jgi:hypothetical protein
VPGLKTNDRHANFKLIAVCFYSLFGMAIIGMCFSVMQGLVKRHLAKLGNIIKIVNSKLALMTSRKSSVKARRQEISMAEKEKEKDDILNKLKMLQQFEKQINARKRKLNQRTND